MKLKMLLVDFSPLQVTGDLDVEISGVHADSRRIKKGGLFVAIRGDQSDGHDFISEAVSAGAGAVICEEVVINSSSVTQIVVKDAQIALAHVASRFHGNPSEKLKVVGVTGTNGKTTTTYLIASIFENANCPTGVLGTLAYRIGHREIPASHTTPPADEMQHLMAQMVNAGCKAAVMEVSSHALVQHRVDDVAWDAGVFTNLTQDHLDYHETMDAYFDAKKILFQRLGDGNKKASAILNLDDPRTSHLREAVRKESTVLTYGLSSEADVHAEKLQQSVEGCRFDLRYKKDRFAISIPLCGVHNVSNSLAAAATAFALGIESSAIRNGLESIKNVPGRLERVVNPMGDGSFSVFVDYAHTDDALRNVLKTLRPLTKGRLITVFGCGGNRDAGKRSLMGRVASEMSDVNIITTDNPRYEDPSVIAQQVVAGFGSRKNFEVILDRHEAIRAALSAAHQKDVVLIAGKGHETYQDVCGTRLAFDDRKIVSEILREISVTQGGVNR